MFDGHLHYANTLIAICRAAGERHFEPVRAVEGRQGQDRVAGAAPVNKQNETESRQGRQRPRR